MAGDQPDMGERGPAPKRESERAGHNAKSDVADKVELDDPVEIPDIDPEWHDKARDWYLALAKSGQSHYYEPSDWAKAHLIADGLSVMYRDIEIGVIFDGESGKSVSPPFATAATLKVLLSEMASLGVTESDRRRMRIEVERKKPPQGPDELADVVRLQFASLDGGSPSKE